jgi:molecular chaperone GrpE
MLKRSRSSDTDNEQRGEVSPEAAEDQQMQAQAEQSGNPEAQPEAVDNVLTPQPEVDKLNAQIKEKDKEIAELKDKYLRMLAESENIRKRLRQQSEETARLQRENLLRELLPIVDNLERALNAAQDGSNDKSIVEGVEMVLRSMLDFLKAQGVSQLSSVGQAFDPQRHEAVDHIDSPAHQPNTVVNEFHRGYLIGDRMLRPARVSVAKGTGGNGGKGGNHEANESEVENR